MTVDEKIQFFFKLPVVPASEAGITEVVANYPGETCKKFSTLYLLRKDMANCFSGSPMYWLGAIAMLSGIDLMAKLYAGTDTVNFIRTRFKNFVNDRMNGEGDDVWRLRNALMHSYGVFFDVPDPAGAGAPSIDKRFRLTAHAVPPASGYTGNLFNIGAAPNVLEIDIMNLKSRFESSIVSYKAHLEANPADKAAKFEPMFEKYGWIYICEKQTDIGGTCLLLDGASGGF